MKQLGFGTMRLPITQGQVDQKETEKLFDRFLAAGFTYFDTAYGYHDYKSEIFVREALVKRHPRESFLLADKMPVWLAKEEADLARLFNEQLEKTGAGYFDYYLLHALGGKNLEAANAVDAWSFVQKKKEEGLVKRIGLHNCRLLVIGIPYTFIVIVCLHRHIACKAAEQSVLATLDEWA